jgi:hypothetical protein
MAVPNVQYLIEAPKTKICDTSRISPHESAYIVYPAFQHNDAVHRSINGVSDIAALLPITMNCKMIAVNKIKLSFFKKNKFLQEENK